MVIRIVHMRFTEAGVNRFLDLFSRNLNAIRHSSGCEHLELLKDAADPLHYTTLSHWDSEHSLEKYRQSALFKDVWGQVKPLFSGPSRAYSMEKFLAADHK
ncbi:MAG TPA: antibiotic biosynthesis monooxygenase family protein [Chryseolinea sp.]|nr:antibiotic biosynthesis monooxygenase family protein [Chryseolinea sp.]